MKLTAICSSQALNKWIQVWAHYRNLTPMSINQTMKKAWIL